METISDTIVNGRRKLVVKYTEEEKEAMRLRAEQHKAEIENRRKKKQEETPEPKETVEKPKKTTRKPRKSKKT